MGKLASHKNSKIPKIRVPYNVHVQARKLFDKNNKKMFESFSKNRKHDILFKNAFLIKF